MSVAAAVRSMTGYASERVDVDGVGSVLLSVKGVNHRFLDLQVRLPMQSEQLDAAVRRAVKAAVGRGHVEVMVQMERPAAGGFAFNEELLAGYVAAFRAAAERLGLRAEPDLNEMARLPGMMVAQQRATTEETEALEAAVAGAMPELLREFNRSRELEGATLAAALVAGMERVEELAAEVAALRQDVRGAALERLRTRLAEMTQGVFSEERLLAEAAVTAERSDVEEELVRLVAHAARFRELLWAGGEVGKRLDFLVQEMNREANTLLSKTGGAASGNGMKITELGLEIKVEVERAKEQVQNLE